MGAETRAGRRRPAAGGTGRSDRHPSKIADGGSRDLVGEGADTYARPVGRKKPQGRLGRWFERVALGAVMGAVAFVVERRLLKLIRRRGREEAGPEGDRRPARRAGRGVQLTLSPEQVDDQPTRQEPADDPQHRR
jgi:hypothetical protein